MVRLNGVEFPWREGLRLDELAKEYGRSEGISFAVMDGKFIPRRTWPETEVGDGAEIRLVAVASGG